jgi:pectate lyase
MNRTIAQSIIGAAAAAIVGACGTADDSDPTAATSTGGGVGAGVVGSGVGGAVTSSGGAAPTGGAAAIPGNTGGIAQNTGGTTGNTAGIAQNTGGTTGNTAGAGTIGDGCPVELVGWAATGEGTTGGGDATPQVVSSLSELQSLAGDDAPHVIHFTGTIDTNGEFLQVASNTTIVGLDPSAIIQGGIQIMDSSNIILQNFSVYGNGDGGSPVDAISARGSHHMWFDHMAVKEGPDGTIDLTRGSDFATVSWCKFWYDDPDHGHRLALLFGGGSTHGDTDEGKNNHTVHHNWFAELVRSRAPRLLFGKGHMFNNFYATEGNNYCIGSGSWASLLVENNYFRNTNDPHRFQDTHPSYIEAVGNIYDNTSGAQDTGNGGSGSSPPGPWNPSDYYAYQHMLDVADNVPDIVQRCAGPQ